MCDLEPFSKIQSHISNTISTVYIVLLIYQNSIAMDIFKNNFCSQVL